MAETLETKRMLLRPAGPQDASLLSHWRGVEDYLELVYSRGKQRCNLEFMIERRKGGEPVGVVYAFSYNQSDGYVFLNVFVEEAYRRFGYGAEACILAICYLFDTLPLYKIYCDAISSNIQSVSMMKGAGLTQEGLLRGHSVHNGVRHDVARFAVHQENLAHLRMLLSRFQGVRA